MLLTRTGAGCHTGNAKGQIWDITGHMGVTTGLHKPLQMTFGVAVRLTAVDLFKWGALHPKL